MSRWKQLLGLDQSTAQGAMQVRVRYLDGKGADGEASGQGFLSVSPRGLVWKVGGYQPGNRDWPDVTSWSQTDDAAGWSALLVEFEGMLRVRQDLVNLHMTVAITATTKEVRRLTAQAERHLAPALITLTAAAARG